MRLAAIRIEPAIGWNGGEGADLDIANRPLPALDALQEIYDMPAGVGVKGRLGWRFIVQCALFLQTASAELTGRTL
jgi:hypothetical protein